MVNSMVMASPESLALVARCPVIRVRQYPRLRRELYRLAEDGVLHILYPGTLIKTADRSDLDVTLMAACEWKPHAVLTRRAAAHMSFWRDLPVAAVDLATPVAERARDGVRFERRGVPERWTWRLRRVNLTHPALTALDLVPELGGMVLSEALRRGIRYEAMVEALAELPRRRANQLRRCLLIAYRGQPWSEPEQRLHDLLRGARIRGWLANLPMEIAGHARFLDLVWEELGLVVEVDGYTFHSAAHARARFETDREIGNWLTVRGWMVLRFTPGQIEHTPDWVIDTIRQAIRHRQLHRSSGEWPMKRFRAA